MAEVGVTVAARNFGSDHSVTSVLGFLNFFFRNGSIKAGPAAPGIILGVRTEQLIPAADAAIDAVIFRLVILSGECPFGSFLPGYMILLQR